MSILDNNSISPDFNIDKFSLYKISQSVFNLTKGLELVVLNKSVDIIGFVKVHFKYNLTAAS